jgi:hypothetical protein
MWPLGKLSKATPTPKGEYKQFCADGYCEADARIRLRHSVANSHERRRGPHEVTIIKLTADEGSVRAFAANCLFIYPGGYYCEEYGPEIETLMDFTGTRDAHGRAVSI